MLRSRILLSGRVQGVGFRYFVLETADEMGLSGEVWNNYDGTVEMEMFCEDRATLDDFVARMKKGPPLSNVSDVRIDVLASDPPLHPGFSIRQ